MTLAEQDKEILRLLSYGYTQTGVAEELDLSVSKVTTRVQELHHEFGTHTAAALVAAALRGQVIA